MAKRLSNRRGNLGFAFQLPVPSANDKLQTHENSDPVRGVVHLVCAVLAARHSRTHSLSDRVAPFTAVPPGGDYVSRSLHVY